MSTIVMIFILPIGIIIYFFDKKTSRQNEEMFQTCIQKIKMSNIPINEKLKKIEDMYIYNDYKILEKSDNSLVIEKKHFNLGVLFIYFGVFSYFGIIFFLIYYRFILKAKKQKIIIE
ncbi:hypothetical protein [Sulfurimonas sp.]|uniref:hypothetical protein n=1 Tax=Sulfurimonas sp. TaxID=2022749 RepID=UPI003D104484